MLKLLSRLFTGLIFLFSGFVKAVDPVGGAIKIADYLKVIGLQQTESVSLILAITLSTIEFIIGFHLFLGIKVKRVALATLVAMVFFSSITLLIAIFEPVSDCGCFGDAIKLTNWQTFIKNVIILPFSIIIYAKKDQYKNQISKLREHTLTTVSLLFILGISYYSLHSLPIIDFRPYKVGTNIPQSMKIPEGAEEGVYETTFILEKDGVQKEFDINNYPYNDSTWVFIDNKTKTIKKGYEPPIQGLAFTSTAGEDLTNTIIDNETLVFLMVAPKIEKASYKHLNEFIDIKNKCLQNGFLFFTATASLSDACYIFDETYSTGFEYALCDETMLKTITRGNPALIVIKEGTIIAKYNHTELPKASDLDNPLSHSLKVLHSREEKVFLMMLLFGLAVIILKTYRLK